MIHEISTMKDSMPWKKIQLLNAANELRLGKRLPEQEEKPASFPVLNPIEKVHHHPNPDERITRGDHYLNKRLSIGLQAADKIA